MGASANIVQSDSGDLAQRGVGAVTPDLDRLDHHETTDDRYTARVEAGTPLLVGPDPEDPGLLQIRMALEPVAPDIVWCHIFNEMPPSLPYALIFHPPEAGSTAITGKARDEELEGYVAHIHERVAATNEHYNETVAAQIKAEAEQREAEQQLEERRLEEARKKLENL